MSGPLWTLTATWGYDMGTGTAFVKPISGITARRSPFAVGTGEYRNVDMFRHRNSPAWNRMVSGETILALGVTTPLLPDGVLFSGSES
jgi:hypothetical protein